MPPPSPRRLVPALTAVALLALSCSDSDDDESSDVVTDVGVDDGDLLDEVVLPGQRSPATSPAGATSSTTPDTTPTTQAGGGSTTTFDSSTTTSTVSTTTSATSSSSTSSSPSSTSSTTPAGEPLRFGPTILVDEGATQSTFVWELDADSAGADPQIASVSWVIDGDAEEVYLEEDDQDSLIVRIGAEYWRSDTTGTLRPVSADEYREERQNILDEVLNTDPGAAIDPLGLDGPGLYQVRTSDVATISEVFGGPPPDSTKGALEGQVEVDVSLRVTFWSLEYTADETTYLLEGETWAAVDGPIERP